MTVQPSRFFVHALASIGLLAVAIWPGAAAAIYGDPDGAFGLEGSFRTIAGFSINYDDDVLFPDDARADAFLQSPLRIIAAGKPDEHWSYTGHLVQFFTASTYASPTGGATLPTLGLSPGTSRYRALDLDWDQVTEPDVSLALSLDRLNAARESDHLSLRFGRQAISLGHAFLWSPMDVYLPFDPRQFDQEYKPGVDAGRVTWAFGDLSGFDVIGVAGRKTDLMGQPINPDQEHAGADWYGSSVLGRLYGNLFGTDVSIQGGKVYGAYQIAAGFAGETRGFDVRGEVSVEIAEPGSIEATPGGPDLIEDRVEATIAAGYYFSQGVTVQAQYFYNGAGDPDDPIVGFVRVAAQESFAVSHHLIGLSANWEATPLINLGGLMVISGDDGSMQIQPILRYSVSDEAEFLVGAAINIGKRPESDAGPPPSIDLRSEFGTSPSSLFFQFKFYF